MHRRHVRLVSLLIFYLSNRSEHFLVVSARIDSLLVEISGPLRCFFHLSEDFLQERESLHLVARVEFGGKEVHEAEVHLLIRQVLLGFVHSRGVDEVPRFQELLVDR